MIHPSFTRLHNSQHNSQYVVPCVATEMFYGISTVIIDVYQLINCVLMPPNSLNKCQVYVEYMS